MRRLPRISSLLLFAILLLLAVTVSVKRKAAAQKTEPDSPSVGSCTAAPPGMVAWWPGEGNANDIRGENNGTLQNGATASALGEVGHAFTFSNDGDEVLVLDSPSQNPGAQMSVDAWIKPTSFNGNASIINKRTIGNALGYTLEIDPTGKLYLQITTSAGDFRNTPPSGALTLNVWQHVVGTYDGSTITVYVNGSALTGSTAANGTINTVAADLVIGKNIVTGASFKGQIDEVELFSRALDITEIQNIFNAGSFGKCRPRCVAPPSGLVGWWTGDDNPFDIFGTNHGALQGGATYGAGKVGRAFNFDGNDAVVQAPDNAAWNFGANDFTIDTWVNFNAISGTDVLLAHDEGSGQGVSKWIFWLNGGQLQLHLNGSSGAQYIGVPWAPATGRWYHVAITRSGGSTYKFYVDGLQIGGDQTNSTTISNAAAPLTIGKAEAIPSLNGLLDEVEVFNRALSQTEIQAINNAASAGKCKKCLAPPSGMVGWWTGDANPNDSSPSTTNFSRTSDDGSNHANANTGDSPLSGNNGTLQGGAGYAFGKVGQAFSFNGSTAYVDAGNAPSLQVSSGDFSVDTWVRFNSLAGDMSIVDKMQSVAASNSDGWRLIKQDDNRFWLCFGGGNANLCGNPAFTVFSTTTATVGTWFHVTVTKTSTNFSLFVNGSLEDSRATPAFTDTSTTNLRFGSNVSFGSFLDGFVDEVEVFNRALSQTEIQSIVAAGASGKCKSTCPAIQVFAANPGGQAMTPAQSPCSLVFGNHHHPDAVETDQVGDVSVTGDVTVAGGTDYQTLDIYSAGPMPFGYDIPIEIADISTTKTFTGNVTVCFNLQAVTDQNTFNQLRVLHLEGNDLIDRTSSHFFPQRQLCATTTTISPFVISQNPNAAPTAANGNIGGTITDSSGAPVSGVTINLSGTQSREAITDNSGRYSFDNVETNGFYTVTPSRVNFTFSPANRSFSLLGVHTEASFTASVNGDHANAIDTTEFFVRQHYLDFLGREPDAPGFAGWVSTLNNCATGDNSCDRVHVSEAFYRSQEFQERGYFAYRFYSTAFGQKPDYAAFVPDLARVSGFLTNDQLEAAKTAFANDFVTRPAFALWYNSLNNSAFVDELMHTAGVQLSNRQTLIDSLNNKTASRAQVLREIAESSEVYQKYYNQAFVVMEYFGYLHRDPDALYTDWIRTLDANPGDSRRMVDGFVNSAEYRNRFAP